MSRSTAARHCYPGTRSLGRELLTTMEGTSGEHNHGRDHRTEKDDGCRRTAVIATHVFPMALIEHVATE